MKKILILISIFIIVSCSKNDEKEIQTLRKENDSLKNVLNGFNDKFIFDKARVKIVPSENNTNKLGSVYKGEFIIVGFNSSDEVLFSTELEDKQMRLVNPIKLKSEVDGYNFEMPLKNKENEIHFQVKANNIVGLSLNGLIISDKKKAH